MYIVMGLLVVAIIIHIVCVKRLCIASDERKIEREREKSFSIYRALIGSAESALTIDSVQ